MLLYWVFNKLCLMAMFLQYGDAIKFTAPFAFRKRSYRRVGPNGITDGAKRWVSWNEFKHFPMQVQGWPSLLAKYNLVVPMEVNGTSYTVPKYDVSPDFRLAEEPWHAGKDLDGKSPMWRESGRFYRVNANNMRKWHDTAYRKEEHPGHILCYCVMVYKRYTPLAMGAVMTYKHILTSALATDLVLAKYKDKKTLQNILGAWYATDWLIQYKYNVIHYMTPARIVYHPKWSPPERTNRSHPIPCVFDLAIWTTTFRFAYYPGWESRWNMGYRTALCYRWSNRPGYGTPPEPREVLVALIIGCQMIFDVDRIPAPWYKYVIRHNLGTGLMPHCPKTDWDWFQCLESNFGKPLRFGVDVGGALHFALQDDSYRYDGLVGLNSFSMKLRSHFMVHYFTIVDRHPVLDFIYDTVKCRLEPNYLDIRFEQVRDEPLQLKTEGGQRVREFYESGREEYSGDPHEPFWW